MRQPIGNEYITSPEGRLAVSFAQYSNSMVQRALLNVQTWLEAWPNEIDPGLVGSLHSPREDQVRSATWELFVNWHLRSQGFKTEKLEKVLGSSTPDFKASKDGTTFYVEATVRFPDKDPLWDDVIKELKGIRCRGITFLLTLKTRSSHKPSVKKIAGLLLQEINRLESSISVSQDLTGQASVISCDDWVIEAVPLRLQSGTEISLVSADSRGSLSPINDDIALRKKIESKRKSYKNLEHPLVLAILENSFSIGDSHIHRFDALFGSTVLEIFEDGTTRLARSDNGLWTRKPKSKECAALLLSHSDPLFMTPVQYPELWLNPSVTTPGVELLNFPVKYILRNGAYGPTQSHQLRNVKISVPDFPKEG